MRPGVTRSRTPSAASGARAAEDTGAEQFGGARQVHGGGPLVGRGVLAGRDGEQVEGSGDPGREVVGDRGRGDPARQPLEELAARLPLQGPDLGRHRGLRKPQDPGGRGEGAGAVDRQEGAQQIQVRRSRAAGQRRTGAGNVGPVIRIRMPHTASLSASL